MRGLGRGAFGKVYLIKEKSNEAEYNPKMDLMSLDVESMGQNEKEAVFEIDVNKLQQRESRILSERES